MRITCMRTQKWGAVRDAQVLSDKCCTCGAVALTRDVIDESREWREERREI